MLVVHEGGPAGGEHAATGPERTQSAHVRAVPGRQPTGCKRQGIGELTRRGAVHERADDGEVGAHRGAVVVVVVDEQRKHPMRGWRRRNGGAIGAAPYLAAYFTLQGATSPRRIA